MAVAFAFFVTWPPNCQSQEECEEHQCNLSRGHFGDQIVITLLILGTYVHKFQSSEFMAIHRIAEMNEHLAFLVLITIKFEMLKQSHNQYSHKFLTTFGAHKFPQSLAPKSSNQNVLDETPIRPLKIAKKKVLINSNQTQNQRMNTSQQDHSVYSIIYDSSSQRKPKENSRYEINRISKQKEFEMQESSHFYLETSRDGREIEEGREYREGEIIDLVQRFQQEAKSIIRGVDQATKLLYKSAFDKIKEILKPKQDIGIVRHRKICKFFNVLRNKLIKPSLQKLFQYTGTKYLHSFNRLYKVIQIYSSRMLIGRIRSHNEQLIKNDVKKIAMIVAEKQKELQKWQKIMATRNILLVLNEAHERKKKLGNFIKAILRDFSGRIKRTPSLTVSVPAFHTKNYSFSKSPRVP